MKWPLFWNHFRSSLMVRNKKPTRFISLKLFCHKSRQKQSSGITGSEGATLEAPFRPTCAFPPTLLQTRGGGFDHQISAQTASRPRKDFGDISSVISWKNESFRRFPAFSSSLLLGLYRTVRTMSRVRHGYVVAVWRVLVVCIRSLTCFDKLWWWMSTTRQRAEIDQNFQAWPISTRLHTWVSGMNTLMCSSSTKTCHVRTMCT